MIDTLTDKLATALPCPFCGVAPKVYPTNPEIAGSTWEQVICQNEGCPANPCVRDGEDIADERGSDAYKALAIKRWNTRAAKASPPQPDDLSARLRLDDPRVIEMAQRLRKAAGGSWLSLTPLGKEHIMNPTVDGLGCQIFWLNLAREALAAANTSGSDGPTPEARERALDAAADALDAARYAHPKHPRSRPHPFEGADRGDREYAYRLTRTAITAYEAALRNGGTPKKETKAETISRLQQEIGQRQSQLQYLVLGDPSKRVSFS